MYVSFQPPPVLTLAVPAEISVRSGTESQPLNLQPYQIVRGVVAEGGLEKVVLNVEHQKLAAKTKVPLRSGQRLNLQVLSTKPQIHLRIMEEAELKHLFRLLHFMDDSNRVLPVVEGMCSHQGKGPSGQLHGDVHSFLVSLLGLLRTPPPNLSGRDLSGLQEMLGLNLEALLAGGETARARKTLKSALLIFAGRSEGSRDGDESGQARNLLEQLKLFALCRFRLAQENVHFHPLPLPFLEMGYLLAERRKTGGAEDEAEEQKNAWKLTMNLRLSFLGNLQVFLLFEENSTLRLRILCESEKTAGIVAGAASGLEERLTSVQLAGFSVGVGAQDPVSSLLKRLAPRGEHFLEVEA